MTSDRANRKILFLDMNSFFASVEQAENAKLHGRPVIVVPTEGSCALSASYEAKAYGVKTGTLEREARRMCPGLVSVRAKPKLYMAYHHRLVALLQNISPRVTMRSVDEGSLRLFNNENPWELASQIKQEIWKELSPVVHCSVGIAPNVFLAKLATELQKPNGLVEITLDSLESTFQRVHLRDLCGINRGMERKLHGLGIYSPFEFYRASPEYLRDHLGIVGHRWWLKLHGYDIDEHYTERRTLSHSHVLPPQYRSPRHAYMTLQRIITKVGRRLRKNQSMARHIALVVRYTDRTFFFDHFQVGPCADTLTLADHVRRLWLKAAPDRPVLQLALWTSNLVPEQGVPFPLFPEERKRLSLAQAIDTINDQFGTDTVHFAVNQTEGSRAPDRISFTALFDIEHE